MDAGLQAGADREWQCRQEWQCWMPAHKQHMTYTQDACKGSTGRLQKQTWSCKAAVASLYRAHVMSKHNMAEMVQDGASRNRRVMRKLCGHGRKEAGQK